MENLNDDIGSDYSSQYEEFAVQYGAEDGFQDEEVAMGMGAIFEGYYGAVDDIFETLQARMQQHEAKATDLLDRVADVENAIKDEQESAEMKKCALFSQLRALKEDLDALLHNIQDSTMGSFRQQRTGGISNSMQEEEV